MTRIEEFQGEYRWLSNFYQCKIILDGMEFQYPENAYQAAKAKDIENRKLYLDIGPGHAKKLSKTIEARDDWNEVRYAIMKDIQEQKYIHNKEFRELLLATGPFTEIREGNRWNDKFWGYCIKTNTGKNNLGKIIMAIRADLLIEDLYET